MGRYIPELSEIGSNNATPHLEGAPNKAISRNTASIERDAKKANIQIREKSCGVFEKPPYFATWCSWIVFYLIILVGKCIDFLEKYNLIKSETPREKRPKMRDFPPLYVGNEWFFFRNVFRRIRDSFELPVCSTPGAMAKIQVRLSKNYNWSFEHINDYYEVINMGSYNYLGFANLSVAHERSNIDSIHKIGLGTASTRQEICCSKQISYLESLVADFLNVESAFVVAQGFATNSLNIPALVNSNCCVISDKLNHASLILGCRMGSPTTYVFKHNDMKSLEEQLIKAIKNGNPKNNKKPFEKCIIIVEGIYSMEGTIVQLPELIALKKRYGAYLYLDEAHSIGALGPNGRGVIDYYGCDPKDVDILMGTFTKSFASSGGYIAGSKSLIDFLRANSQSSTYGGVMSAPICQQIVNTIHSISSFEGQTRIRRLAWNTRYFRAGLHRMRLIVMGDDDSPVVPVLVLTPCSLLRFGHLSQKMGLAAALVGFPAVKVCEDRIRFCMSASHTKEMLDEALGIVEKIAKIMRIQYSRRPIPLWCLEYKNMSFEEDCKI